MTKCYPYKVLSIDFDYFVDATREEKFGFPDPNENLSIDINTFLWVTHYAEQQLNVKRFGKQIDRSLDSIPVNRETFTQVLKYLKMLKYDSSALQVIVANSHSAIFPYLEQKVNSGIPVKVCNLDDHSDFYGIGSDLNCGNWGNLLYNSVRKHNLLSQSEVNWVGQPDSITHSEEDSLYKEYAELLSISHVAPEDVSEYLQAFFGETPDMIFLCRSSCWVPPHLDFKFLEMVEVLQKYQSNHILIEERVRVPRYTSKFKKQVKQYYDNFSVLGI